MERNSANNTALKISNAFKSFNKHKVINNLNLNVPTGIIYGLLGPSGCGKTTLLSSIVGTQNLDAGTIDINADTTSQIGFMPQELQLDKYLTIYDTLKYYGTLYNMTEKQMLSRIEELCEFLEINFPDKLIKDLSGGQCRRVSMAVSLIHDPQIIILDEPTVGLDPILSHKIWNYLVDLVKNKNKTIVITTHYIQEAAQADMIGLMRQGKIIEEMSPIKFLKKYNTDSLEIAFLKICENISEEKDIVSSNDINLTDLKYVHHGLDKSRSYITFHRIRALVRKNYLISYRDYMYFFFAYVMPLYQIFFTNMTIGNRLTHNTIAVSNSEINISKCNNISSISCLFDDYDNDALSCDILNYLKSQDYNIEYFEDSHEGLKAVDTGLVSAFINFPNNYTNALRQYIVRDNRFTLNEVSLVHFDNTSVLLKNQIVFDLYQGVYDVMINVTSRCTSIKNSFKVPLNIKKLYGAKANSLRHVIIGKELIFMAFYFASACSATFMLLEKLDGLLSRSMVAGVSIVEVVISLLLVQSIGFTIQNTLFVLISLFIFENPIEISFGLWLIPFLLTLISVNGFLYGLIASAVSTNSVSVMFLTFGYNLSEAFIGDYIWPLISQPWYLQIISYNLPITVYGRLITNITVKALPLSHPIILIDLTKAIGHIFLHVGAAFIIKYIKKDAWVLQN
ncbi:ABC transporter G family member 23-like [Daktulosphaira vitifoliae]|uniref:ABC transporter G family member 23-like n=1 Tax=Daktulosphaira vitifoliae TaxID=58002 RepID=UPI0021A9C9F9|nr:ABC transporter G family member 23-like [Daktulosphaira vitifoliae]